MNRKLKYKLASRDTGLRPVRDTLEIAIGEPCKFTAASTGRRPVSQWRSTAFTLIETMLAVLLMALLAGAVSMSFPHPLQTARSNDAIDRVRSFDAMGRQAATRSDRNIRLVFDMATDTLIERDGTDLTDLRTRIALPQGCRIDSVRVDGHSVTAGQAMIDLSSHGWSKSYAVHLLSPGADRWLVFAGMTGLMTQVQNESQIPTFHAEARHNAD